MSPTKKIAEAKTTCDGLYRLIRKLNSAAVDLDKSGGSAYELAGLLASAHACVSSLGTQLDELADNAVQLDAVPANALADSALPDSALPDNALPDNALPDNALPDRSLPTGPASIDRQSVSDAVTPLHRDPVDTIKEPVTIEQPAAVDPIGKSLSARG